MKLPNGYGSIIKLGGKRRNPYAARVTIGTEKVEKDGKIQYIQKFKYLGYFINQKEALDCLANYNSLKMNNSSAVELLISKNKPSTIVPTFKILADEWYKRKEMSNREYSESTLTHYRTNIQRTKELWNYPVNLIDNDTLQGFIDQFCDKAKPTLTELRTVLTGVLDLAIKKGYIATNQAKLCEYNYSNAENKLHKPYSYADINTIWNHKDNDIAKMILITIYTGMRPTELLRIKVEDVHIDKKYMIGGIKTKAGKNRVIPIHDKILDIVKYFCNGKYLIEIDNEPIPYRKFLDLYRDFCDSIDIEYHTPHDGRHTCSTELEKQDVKLLLRQRILGHSSRNVTESVYTDVEVPRLIEAINKLKYAE